MEQVLDVVMQILKALYHFCQTPAGNTVLAATAPLLLGWVYHAFHLNPQRQSEVGHAVNYVIKGLSTGKFDFAGAVDQILATGKVKEGKATEIVNAVIEKRPAVVAPTKGVIVTINPDGNVSVDPSGLAAKLTYKASKWLKKVF